MRNAVFWVISVIVVAGALSAVVASATVKWLYPKQQPVTHVAAPVQTQPPASSPATTNTADEIVAFKYVQDAANGVIADARLKDQVTRHQVQPLRAARLPGNAGKVLVWVNFRDAGATARGLYEVTVTKGKVSGLQGPIAPEGGFGPHGLQFYDEQAKPVDLATYQGRPLVLLSARKPEVQLGETLVSLYSTLKPLGVEVVLVSDIRSPDWIAAARQAGFMGKVWRIKGRLEDVPLVSKGTVHGAYGLLIDPQGYAVGSAASLEPLHYNLPDETPSSIAPIVLRAYGLLP